MAKEIEDGPVEPRAGSVSGGVEAGGSEDGGQASDAVQTDQTSTATQTAAEKAWKEYGIDGWDNKPREQIAKEVAFQRSVSGRQAAELGRLRKEHQMAQTRLAELQKLAGGNTNAEGQTVKEAIEDMDPAEKLAFFNEINEGNPRKAIRRALGDLGIPKKEDIEKMIEEGVNKRLGQYHDWNEENAIRSSEPEYSMYEDDINYLRDKENPDSIPDRSRRECYDLVKLSKENRLLAGFVYDLMKKSSLPFSECKRLANLEISAQQTNDDAKNKVADEIKKGNRTTPTGGKTPQSSDRAKSWDDL
jgi:hypothetical protein